MKTDFKINEKYLEKLLLIVTSILFGLLIYSIIKYPYLSVDGAFTRGLVTLPFWDLINVTAIDVHPPLYYLGLKAMIQIFSVFNIDIVHITEFYSLIPYLIILIISYTKIKKDYGVITAGIFSLTLLSMSLFFNFYTMARMYSWSMLFVLLAFISAKDILENSTYKSWILLGVFSVLCAYTHYYAAIAVFVLYVLLFIHIILNKSKMDMKSELKKMGASIILGIILFIPWIFALIGQVSNVSQGYWISDVDLSLLISCLSNWLFYTSNFTIEIISIFVLILFSVYIIEGYLSSRELDDYYILLGALVFFGTILMSVVISLTFKPILVLRYLLPVFSILWLSISIKIGKIKNDKLLVIIIILIIAISFSNVLPQIDSQHHSFNRFNDENQVYESINNNDSIILYDDLPRSIRLYYRLNDTYQDYGNFMLNNKLHSLDYKPYYLDNNSVFNIPQDNEKYGNKNVYIVTGHNLANGSNIQYEQLENVRNAPKIFKVNVTNNAPEELLDTQPEDTKDYVDFKVIPDSSTAGGKLKVTVESGSNLERRINVTVGTETKLVTLEEGIATVEFENLSPGTCQISVSYKGDSNYKPTTVTTNVDIK